ncbi:MAG: glycosyltransferase family 39 protein [Patescibacteria group bacterium]
MNIEVIFLILIFVGSLYVIHRNLRDSLLLAMLLSLLLHKELFSIYRWDVLPVRVFMLALTFYAFLFIVHRYRHKINFKEISSYLRDPFIFLLGSIWVARGISLLNTKNLQASIFLYGFFTTVIVLGFAIYYTFNSSSDILSFIKKYIYLLFFTCLFGFIQFFIYLKFDYIVGALWNVPGHLPRIGSVFWDINHYGGLLASLLPVVGVLVLVEKKVKTKLLYLLILIPMTGILLMTSSRTAWLLGLTAFLVFVVVLLVRKFKLKGILYLAGFLILISIPVIREYNIKSSPFRAYVRQNFHYRIDSFDSHFLLIQGAFQVFEKYPYIGGGYGSFFEHFSKTKIAPTYFARDPAGLNTRVPAHTIWGEIFSETGILGSSLFILLMLLVILTLLYAALTLQNKRDYLLSTAMLGSTIGWGVAGIFYSYNSEFFWLIFFLYFTFGVKVLGDSYNVTNIVNYFFTSNKTYLAFVASVSFCLIFIGLGKNHLLPWDEAIYAEIAKNMNVTGDYIVQYWKETIPWFEKPPLMMWLMSFSTKLFGMSEFAVRLPSALLGFGTVLVTYYFGRKLFNKTAGLLAALVLVTTTQFLYYSRTSMLDVSLTFFITLSLYMYYLARSKNTNKLFVFSGVFGGLAFMVKGVVGLLVFPIIGLYELYLLFSGELKLKSKTILQYINLFISYLVIALPWHIASYAIYGREFYDTYIGYHVLTRATQEIEDKGQPWYWYLIVMKVSMRIWFVALLGAFPFSLVSASFAKLKYFSSNARQHAFLVIWVLVVLIFFSSSKSKLVWYVMPLYPAASLMVGAFMERVLTIIDSKLFSTRNALFRYLAVYFIVLGGLFYLFLSKNLVYTSDLTGSQAELLQVKDATFGTESIVYADRIELPLILFYSDSPFEVVDFGPLKDTLSSAKYSQEIIFITKESRFSDFADIYNRLELEGSRNEWVLGRLPSKHEIDLETLHELEVELERFDKDIAQKREDNEFIPPHVTGDRERIFNEIETLKQEIELKLNAS